MDQTRQTIDDPRAGQPVDATQVGGQPTDDAPLAGKPGNGETQLSQSTNSDDAARDRGTRTDVPEPLLPADALSDFQDRWNDVQAGFVDDPRAAVRDAEGLVNEMVSRLTDVFTTERSSLEDVWRRGDQASTEDLRMALQRYRSFFGRLLAA